MRRLGWIGSLRQREAAVRQADRQPPGRPGLEAAIAGRGAGEHEPVLAPLARGPAPGVQPAERPPRRRVGSPLRARRGRVLAGAARPEGAAGAQPRQADGAVWRPLVAAALATLVLCLAVAGLSVMLGGAARAPLPPTAKTFHIPAAPLPEAPRAAARPPEPGMADTAAAGRPRGLPAAGGPAVAELSVEVAPTPLPPAPARAARPLVPARVGETPLAEPPLRPVAAVALAAVPATAAHAAEAAAAGEALAEVSPIRVAARAAEGVLRPAPAAPASAAPAPSAAAVAPLELPGAVVEAAPRASDGPPAPQPAALAPVAAAPDLLAPADAPPLRPVGVEAVIAAGEQAPEGGDGTAKVAAARRRLVAAVQRALAEAGIDPGAIDGVEGPKTWAAVRDYQRRAGLRVDGAIDLGLLRRLETPRAAPARSDALEPAGAAGTGGGPFDGIGRALDRLFGTTGQDAPGGSRLRGEAGSDR